MNYTITLSDGTNIVVPPSTIDTSTSLFVIGQDTINFGSEFYRNFIRLLENFCNSEPPTNPINGQTWYNSKLKQLQWYNNKWHDIKPEDIDVSAFVRKLGDKLTGPLITDYGTEANSIINRSQIEDFEFNPIKLIANNQTSIQYDDKYTIISAYATSQNQQITLPYTMIDTNYSIIATINDINKTSAGYHTTIYNKTTTSFNVVCNGLFDTISFVIMGFAA